MSEEFFAPPVAIPKNPTFPVPKIPVNPTTPKPTPSIVPKAPSSGGSGLAEGVILATQLDRALENRRRRNQQCPRPDEISLAHKFEHKTKPPCTRRRKPCSSGEAQITYKDRIWNLGIIPVMDENTFNLLGTGLPDPISEMPEWKQLLEDKEREEGFDQKVDFIRLGEVDAYSSRHAAALWSKRTDIRPIYYNGGKIEKGEVLDIGQNDVIIEEVDPFRLIKGPLRMKKWCIFRVVLRGKRRICKCPDGKKCRSTSYTLCPPRYSNYSITLSTVRYNLDGEIISQTHTLQGNRVPGSTFRITSSSGRLVNQTWIQYETQSFQLKVIEGSPKDMEIRLQWRIDPRPGVIEFYYTHHKPDDYIQRTSPTDLSPDDSSWNETLINVQFRSLSLGGEGWVSDISTLRPYE